MSDDKTMNKNKDQPTHALIEKIKDGNLDPSTLDKDMRQQCVELFQLEGYGISAIAQILKRSDKTIKRDLADICERNKLRPDPELIFRQVGEMVIYARINRAHLMRLARVKTGKTSEKAQAEYYAHRVNMEVIERLQSLGYLPSQAQVIIGDFSHHVSIDGEKSFEELRCEIIEVEKVYKECGEFPEEKASELNMLKEKIEKAEIEYKIQKVRDQKKEGVDHEPENK